MDLQTTLSETSKKPFSGRWGRLLSVLKWVLLLLSCGYLLYKLFTFNHYSEVLQQWRQMPVSQWIWLLAVLLLLPLNWGIEAVKWQMLTEKFQKIGFRQAVQAVLAGISTGFFTPNRVGEMVGRVAFLDMEHRKAGVTMSVVNSLTQNLVMAVCGIPAALFYFYQNTLPGDFDNDNFLMAILVFVIFSALLYFYLPSVSRFFLRTNVASHVADFVKSLSEYSRNALVKIVGVSLIRYVVFGLQFFCMLHFFGVSLAPADALIAIPTNYLFVTFSPSFAFSEAAVRSSYAVLFIGIYSGLTVNIALAGVFIWFVNFVLPMLAGSLLLLREPE